MFLAIHVKAWGLAMKMRSAAWAMTTAAMLVVGLVSMEEATASGTEVPLVKGRVLTAAGTPAGRTRISMLAWPADDRLGRLAVGESFGRAVLAGAVTDAGGRYSLTTDSLDRLASVADGNGVVNVDVIAERADGTRAVASTPLSEGTTRNLRARRLSSDSPGKPESSAVLMPDLRLQRWAGARGTAAANSSGARQSLATSCGTTYIADLGLHDALIGAHYDTTSSVRHDWEFTAGASATLGVGVSSTGGYGSWRASGSTTNSSSVTINFPEATSNRHDYTKYSWGKYRTRCYEGGNLISTTYQAKVRTLAGGASTWSPPSAPSAGHCVYYPKSAVFSKTSTKQSTHSTGADVSSALGIDLSVQSGYTTSSKVTYRFDQGRQLCGTKDYPGANLTSGLFVAKL